MHDPIAYVYDADVHCPGCAEERFGRADDGFIAGQSDADGSYPEDSEGNPVGVIAPWDDWTQGTGERETLACGTCGGVIEEYEGEPLEERDYFEPFHYGRAQA